MPQHPSVDLAPFPPGFRWSAATAAFQVEGARTADGGAGRSGTTSSTRRVPSAAAATADPGPDSYRRHREDVALLAGLGVDRYRFSISWVRVQPEPGGPVLQAGLDYYRRLADDLLDAGITPFATLYHWDLPSVLEADGGWLTRDTALRFGEYAAIVAAALGDRIRHWYTLNEPVSTSLQGYAVGTLAPGSPAAVRLAADGAPSAARPRPGAAGAAGRRRRRGGHRQQPHAGASRERDGCRPRRRGDVRRAAQPPLRRARAHRGVPRPGGVRHPADAGRGRRSRAHLDAGGLLRHQLLQPDDGGGRSRRTAPFPSRSSPRRARPSPGSARSGRSCRRRSRSFSWTSANATEIAFLHW